MRRSSPHDGPWLIAAAILAALGAIAAVSLTAPPAARPRAPTPQADPAAAAAGAPAPPTAVTAATRGLVLHGPRTRREIALTFDADMTPGMLIRLRAHVVRSWYDRSITDYLRSSRTPATIFVTGLWARTYASDVRALAADRLFEIENHSLDHYAFAEPCFGLPPARRQQADVTDAATAIVAAGAPPPRYFRFPGGCHSAAGVRMINSLGEQPVNWDVASGDAFQKNAGVIVGAVLSQVRPGSIVIMHCMGPPNAPATAEALRAVVPALRSRGYRFVTLHGLLGA